MPQVGTPLKVRLDQAVARSCEPWPFRRWPEQLTLKLHVNGGGMQGHQFRSSPRHAGPRILTLKRQMGRSGSVGVGARADVQT